MRFLLLLFALSPFWAMANQIDSLKQVINNTDGIEKGKNYLTLANYFLKTENDSAIYYAKKALSIAHEHNDMLQSKCYSGGAKPPLLY